MFTGSIDIEQSLIFLIVVVISISVHEFAHAISADRLGDDLPRRQGRITLLPTEHFDPLGFIMIVWLAFGGIGLGWGKPVQVNPGAFKHPRRDMIIVAAAGPFSNLIIATVVGLGIRFLGVHGLVDPSSGQMTLLASFLFAFMTVNLSLMLFNLIPIPPLDGSKILSGLLPIDLSVRYDRVMGQWGFFILIGLIFFGRPILSEVIWRPAAAMMRILIGPLH